MKYRIRSLKPCGVVYQCCAKNRVVPLTQLSHWRARGSIYVEVHRMTVYGSFEKESGNGSREGEDVCSGEDVVYKVTEREDRCGW